MVEGTIKLLPGRGQWAALLEGIRQLGIKNDEPRSQDSPVGFGKQHRDPSAEVGQLVTMAVSNLENQPLAFQSPQIVGGLSGRVGRIE